PDGSSGCSLRHLRNGSPPGCPLRAGGSTLITSAPKSAIIRAANGPAINCPSSSTRRPASGPVGDASPALAARGPADGASRDADRAFGVEPGSLRGAREPAGVRLLVLI